MKTVEMQVADNLSVTITPDSVFEFVMPTNEVAKGYGISTSSLRYHKHEHRDELVEGKHYFTSVGKTNASGNQSVATYWTKRGIVRLGFFIKSERARMFRDWAEDLVISTMENAERMQEKVLFPEPTKRNHNRLTPERMISILSDVAKIGDQDLRMSLVEKLTKY